MHQRHLLSIGVATFLVIACGGDSSNGNDGGSDATNDQTSGNDGSAKDGSSNDGSGNDGTVNDSGGGDVVAEGGGGLSCGTSSCSSGQACCVDPNNAGTYTCTGDAGTCPAGDALLNCKSAADCSSSQVCCIDANVDPAVASCTTTCTGNNRAELCDPNGTTTSNRCGDAGACGNNNIDTWQLTTTYGTCGDKNGPF